MLVLGIRIWCIALEMIIEYIHWIMLLQLGCLIDIILILFIVGVVRVDLVRLKSYVNLRILVSLQIRRCPFLNLTLLDSIAYRLGHWSQNLLWKHPEQVLFRIRIQHVEDLRLLPAVSCLEFKLLLLLLLLVLFGRLATHSLSGIVTLKLSLWFDHRWMGLFGIVLRLLIRRSFSFSHFWLFLIFMSLFFFNLWIDVLILVVMLIHISLFLILCLTLTH